jgi:glycine/D-amino acid oxidase-like deaminating enzyme
MPDELELEADVLVVGGSLAGTWVAVGAAKAGADVILVDKGYCGTSWCPRRVPADRAGLDRSHCGCGARHRRLWISHAHTLELGATPATVC